MSMNLCFETISGRRAFIDFPFQTPTELTFKVMEAKTILEKMQLIKDQMIAWKWSKDEIDSIMAEIHDLITDPMLRLTYV